MSENLFYRVSYAEPDGKNGYYRKAPEIELKNLHRNYVTKYCVRLQNGMTFNGKIMGRNRVLVIPASRFPEGKHTLEVWADTGEDVMVKGSKQVKEIRVDSQKPEKPIKFSYEKDGAAPIYYSHETSVKVSASDSVSGIEGIYYRIGGGKYLYKKGENITVSISQNFRGTISAYAIDRAGNKSDIWKSKEILVDCSAPQIKIEAPVKLDEWRSEGIELLIHIEETGISSGIKKVECFLNEQCKSQKVYREAGNNRNNMVIKVDEHAMLKICAEDFAGNKTYKEQEIRIDKEAPKVEIIGVQPYEISQEDIAFKLQVTDESGIVLERCELEQEQLSGEKRKSSIENWRQEERSWEKDIVLQEEGSYRIYIEGMDAAGNQIKEMFSVTIDRSAPEVEVCEWMEGSVVPFFQWNDELERNIVDLTDVRLECRLNGRLCEKDKVYDQDGRYFLEITARDKAGNESMQTIHFIIDTEAALSDKKKANIHKIGWRGLVILGIIISGWNIIKRQKNKSGKTD